MRKVSAFAALVAVSVLVPVASSAQSSNPQPVVRQEAAGPVYRLTDGTVLRFGRTPPADNFRMDVRESLRPPLSFGPSTPPAYCFNASPYC